MEKRPFLRWMLVNCAVATGLIILWWSGAMRTLWEKDSSYLSYITLALYWVMAIRCGMETWEACQSEQFFSSDVIEERRKRLGHCESLGWFMSELCLALGMLGTVVGFVMMLSGFETLDISNVSSVQGLLGDLGKSMATALYTTLVGLVCGCLLKIQYFNLGLQLDGSKQ